MTELPVVSPPPKKPRPASLLRSVSLKLYRVTVLALILFLIRDYYVRIRVQGNAPLVVEEVQALLPTAHTLRVDHGARRGLFILDQNLQVIGYAIRTSPISDDIIGYCGPSDTLIVFDEATGKIAGLAIRSSGDTTSHVNDVRNDDYYMNLWTDYSWDDLTKVDLSHGDIEGVSGATMTSMGIAHAIVNRIRHAQQQERALPPFRISTSDGLLIGVCIGALLLTFTRLKRYHRLRTIFKWSAFLYIGFISGDLLAESLFAGWAKYSFPWRQHIGLVFLAAVAVFVPWSTRRNVYCQQICPHGTAQEFLGKRVPAKRKWKLRADVKRGLRWIPALLLVLILCILFLDIPIDLAELEAFDAYLLASAGIVSIIIAVTGLLTSLFVPQAYCRYGCPTGTIFEFVRSHGRADHFGRSDWVGGLFLVLTLLLNQYAETIKVFLYQ